MKHIQTTSTAARGRRIVLLSIVFVLMIPFIAMQFTDQVVWTIFDFLIAAILLLTTGFAIEFIIRKVKRTEYKLLICLAILLGVFLVWAELAVGIFGSAFAGS